MSQLVVISTNAQATVVKCPKCKLPIRLYHEAIGKPNDGFGRLDLGIQNYRQVVCMQRLSGRTYCDWTGDIKAADVKRLK